MKRRREDTLGPDFAPAPEVFIIEDASARATVIEVRAHDFPGLLRVVSETISRVGVDIVAARVATLGSEAVDAFYVVEKDGQGTHLSDARAQETRSAIIDALLAINASATSSS